MEKIFHRFTSNPILKPSDIRPSLQNLSVECLLNPGVFRFKGQTGLLLRVAERPFQRNGYISFPILSENNKIIINEFPTDDPDLDLSDSRVIRYKGKDYLTTMSHLRPVFSSDGLRFRENNEYPPVFPSDEYTAYGIEDCRVAQIGNTYYLTFTAVSEHGVGVGMKSTEDWKQFSDYGLIFPPHNKDCALFDEKINGKYYALHRPSSPEIGGNYIWIAESEDLKHWGGHKCIAHTREGKFDSRRLGAGASPIKTEKGWLVIYHGATSESRYCLGAILLDLNNPSKVIARSDKPIMEPEMPYELDGFFGQVIFTNGHLLDGDEIIIYYGAADEVICAAKASISGILKTLCV